MCARINKINLITHTQQAGKGYNFIQHNRASNIVGPKTAQLKPQHKVESA